MRGPTRLRTTGESVAAITLGCRPNLPPCSGVPVPPHPPTTTPFRKAPVYITPEELQAFIYGVGNATALPDNAAALIRSAEGLVNDALRGAVYRVDEFGFAEKDEYAAAITNATAEQAQAWVLAGIDPRLGVAQLPDVVVSKSALGVSTTVQASSRRDLEALASGQQLTSAALAYLNRAGLITAHIGTPGASQRRLVAVYSPTDSGLI